MCSHLQGMFFRTARMLESGMKPVYIFDGKPPDAKKEELNRRFEKRGDATEDLEKVKEVCCEQPALLMLSLGVKFWIGAMGMNRPYEAQESATGQGCASDGRAVLLWSHGFFALCLASARMVCSHTRGDAARCLRVKPSLGNTLRERCFGSVMPLRADGHSGGCGEVQQADGARDEGSQ